MATKDTHPTVTADSGSPSGPALAPVSSPTRQPAATSRAATRLAGTTGAALLDLLAAAR